MTLKTNTDPYAVRLDEDDLEYLDFAESAVPAREGIDFVVKLPTGSTRPTFTDRCRVVRAESYRRQQERNARFEHLRRLLCTPAPVEEPEVVGLASVEEYEAVDPNEGRSARCVCCHEHRSPLMREGQPGWDDAYTYLFSERSGITWGLRNCPTCIADHYEESRCPAPLHCHSIPEADSFTVRTDAEDDRLSVVSFDVESWEEPDEMILDGGEDFFHRRAFESPEARETPREEWDTRAKAAITVNVKSGWVTYTSSQAKARVTLNATSNTVSLRYGRLLVAKHSYASTREALAARDRIAWWAAEWLEGACQSTNVAVATTQKCADPVASMRRLRDQLDRKNIRTNVRIYR